MDDVIVGSGAVIASNASLPFGSVIPHKCINVKRALVINGVGEHKQMTAIDCDDGLIINIGCMNNCKGLPITDAKKEIAKKYPDENHLYYSVLRLAQEWYDNENEKGVETELKDPELDAPSLEGSGVYNLNLFKSVKIAANAYMVRVPGGWILNQYQESVTNTWAMTSCFIPYTKP